MTEIVREDFIEKFICALSTEDNKHICEEAVSLSCNHHACKQCTKPYVTHRHIICSKCNQFNTKEINLKKLDHSFESILDENINQVFKSIVEYYKNKFEKLQQMMIENDETVDLQVDFVKDEVQVRIESLKIELDRIGDSMNEQLEEIKTKWRNDLQESNKKLINDDKLLIEFKNKIEREQESTKKSLYNLQNDSKVINEAIKRLKNTGSLQLMFEEKDLTDVVGKIVHTYPSIGETERSIIKTIKQNSFRTINLVKDDVLSRVV